MLDRLALVGSTGRGALEFRPDDSVVSKQEYADFGKLALDAEQILDSEDYTGEGIEEFQYRGGSPGGARPKIFTRFEDKEWLNKVSCEEGFKTYRCRRVQLFSLSKDVWYRNAGDTTIRR